MEEKKSDSQLIADVERFWEDPEKVINLIDLLFLDKEDKWVS